MIYETGCENKYHIKYIEGFDSRTRTTEINEKNVCGVMLPYITYKIFDNYSKTLVHGFSTRYGGTSSGYLASLNLSFSRGDDRDRVIENHRRFACALGYDYNRLVFSEQVHGCGIYAVTESDSGRGIAYGMDKLSGIDGLCTDCSKIPLITFYADCVPVFFYDPVRNVAALAHSGWRGTVSDIAGKMVNTMNLKYGCEPGDIICAIGPSICRSCYEVGTDVADEFRRRYKDGEISDVLRSIENGKYLLDLHSACRYNLLAAGVDREHIAMPDLCTCCNPDFLYSHRASKGMRGNLAAVIMLR